MPVIVRDFSSIQEWGMYSIVISYEHVLFEPFKVMKWSNRDCTPCSHASPFLGKALASLIIIPATCKATMNFSLSKHWTKQCLLSKIAHCLKILPGRCLSAKVSQAQHFRFSLTCDLLSFNSRSFSSFRLMLFHLKKSKSTLIKRS